MDDLDDRPPPPRRPRTEWWRWNLVTLAVTLFVLVWVREILKWEYSTTFFFAGITALVWIMMPFAFEYEMVAQRRGQMLQLPKHEKAASLMNHTFSPIPISLKLVRLYAAFHMLLSIAVLIVNLWWMWNTLGWYNERLGTLQSVRFGVESQVMTCAVWPLAAAGLGAALWVLTDIAITRRVELNWRMQQRITPPQPNS